MYLSIRDARIRWLGVVIPLGTVTRSRNAAFVSQAWAPKVPEIGGSTQAGCPDSRVSVFARPDVFLIFEKLGRKGVPGPVVGSDVFICLLDEGL